MATIIIFLLMAIIALCLVITYFTGRRIDAVEERINLLEQWQRKGL